MFGVKGLNKRNMRFSLMCCWKSTSSEAWHFDVGWALPSVPNDRSVFIFRVKKQSTCPWRWRHHKPSKHHKTTHPM